MLSGLAALSVAAACGSSTGATTTSVTLVPEPGGSATVGIDQAPTGCNPNTVSGDTSAVHQVLAPVLPSPFVVDASGQSSQNQDLVTSAEPISLSPLTIVYTLNPKAVWQDGVPIGAADFVYAWKQQRGAAADPGAPASDAASVIGYRDIRSVVGSNQGRTVKVTFATPFSDWQMLFHDLLPAHVMERVGWNPACDSVAPAIDLSGGPYLIRSVVPGRQVVLAANPRWWGTPVDLARITVRTGSGPTQLATWARHDGAQVIQPGAFTDAFLQSVTADPRLNGAVTTSSTFLQLEFSTTEPATSDPKVRAAVAHAVDRQALVDSVVGFADPHIVPSNSHLYTQDQPGYPTSPNAPSVPNPLDAGNQSGTTTTTTPPPSTPGAYPAGDDRAATARLLTAAGYATGAGGAWVDAVGNPLVLRLVVDTGDAWSAATGPLLARQLKQAGLGVTVTDAPDATAAGTALAAGHADMALLPFDTSPYPSRAVAWFTPSLGAPGANGSENWTNLDDPTLSGLLAKAVQELNPVTAQPYYAKADQLLWDQMVALPLFAEPSVLVWGDRLANVNPNPDRSGLFWDAGAWEHLVLRSGTAGSVTPATPG